MTHEEAKTIKEQTWMSLQIAMTKRDYADRLAEIDPRLVEYVNDCLTNHGEHSNMYELLGIRKVFRLMSSYEMNPKRVVKVIRAIEGVWKNGKHVKGGLKFDTPRGNMHVRLMPYQVWCVFGIYGFITEVCMERPFSKDDANLLPTEFERDGMVWDKRRLTSEAHIFQTRKSGKTEFGSAIDFVDVCFLGDVNSQALICCNSSDQGKIAYKAIRQFAECVDPACINKGGGRYFRVTADEMNWLPGQPRKGEIKVMSAGGKTKDGLYASIVHADEHGSAGYVKDHSDMQSLVEVCAGSMGPRREKLLMHTTTAGLVNNGPYQIQLRSVEASLVNELNYELGKPIHTDDDKWFAFLLRLDPWEEEYSLEQLNDVNLFRKVNRSIGITVQPTWYRERLYDAATKGEDTKKEVLTKDFNIWQTDRVKAWITPAEIFPLQIDRRVFDLDEDWVCFLGGDFSKGEDLNALSALCYNINTGEFFADCFAWITEWALQNHSNAALYQLWAKQGWLYVSPDKTIDENLILKTIMQISDHVTVMRIGYDAYDAKRFINAIGAWIFSMGQDPTAFLAAVSQNFATYNSPVQEMTYMIRNNPPLIRFSNSPLWPWEFGCCHLQESSDGMENVKPVKASASENCKVDNVQALLSALHLYDQAQGSIVTNPQ